MTNNRFALLNILVTIVFFFPISAESSTKNDLIINGNLSVALSPGFSFADFVFMKKRQPLVTFFYIRPNQGDSSNIQITTMGFGETTIWQEKETVTEQCKLPKGKLLTSDDVLKIDKLTNPMRICIKIPAQYLPEQGEKISGDVMVFFSDYSIKIPIEIRTKKMPIFWTGSLWFFGIIVPAVFTGLVGYILSYVTKPGLQKIDENLNFRRNKLQNDDQLQIFFGSIYAGAIEKSADKEFARVIQDDLNERGILDIIPGPRKVALNNALNKGNRVQIKRLLKKLFPRYKKTMIEAEK